MIKCDIVIHKEFIYDDAGQFCEAKIAPQDGFDIQTYGAGRSSSVARWAHNPKVAGSNPAPATICNTKGHRGYPSMALCVFRHPKIGGVDTFVNSFAG